MSTIAYGAEKVKALQYALGGKPPARSAKQARMRLNKYVAERFKALKAERQEEARLTAPLRDRLFSQIPKDDPDLKRSIEETRRFVERRGKRKIPQPKTRRIEPRFVAAPLALFKVPPYDDDLSFSTDARSDFASADKVAGNYNMGLFSAGDGLHEARAGIAVWFFSTIEDPRTRVAAELDYSDNWGDLPFYNVATNALYTRIWVWGDKEQNWVVQSDLQPSWGDHVSGQSGHGNSPGESGTSQIYTFFPAQANNWYWAVIWTEAWVYSESFPGFGLSYSNFSTAVPVVAFGGIFP